MIDHYAVQNRHVLGVDNLLWSTDYPHHGCDWPETRRIVDEMFRGVPARGAAEALRPERGEALQADLIGRRVGPRRPRRRLQAPIGIFSSWPTKMRFGSLITSGFARTMFWKADALP